MLSARSVACVLFCFMFRALMCKITFSWSFYSEAKPGNKAKGRQNNASWERLNSSENSQSKSACPPPVCSQAGALGMICPSPGWVAGRLAPWHQGFISFKRSPTCARGLECGPWVWFFFVCFVNLHHVLLYSNVNSEPTFKDWKIAHKN